jgi:RNA polymerase sigma-70 factor, ECF subfamily
VARSRASSLPAVVAANGPGSAPAETARLASAQAGDERAFEALLVRHRRSLHVHCYRLLGSVHDADDALQETALRAWRGLPRYEPRASLSAWLYRIATNVCLRMMERRQPRTGTLDAAEAAVAAYLEPYPDHPLADLAADVPGPDDVAVEREGLMLSVVAAMQLLPPRQRAVLVLRDGLGWPARDVADLLGESVASVNSALQRGRARLERERRAGALARDHVPAPRAAESAVMREFLEAWEAVDVPRIVSLLSSDALMTMPPEAMRIVGADAIGAFFSTVPADGALGQIRLLETRSNGQPALAAYLAGDDGVFHPYGVMVFSLDGDTIVGITGFADFPTLVPRFGLPRELR